MTMELPEGYEPSPDEEYMNQMQLEYFRRQLLRWREELMTEAEASGQWGEMPLVFGYLVSQEEDADQRNALLRELAREGGCHVWSERDDVITSPSRS